jgi:hypothetical protein
MEDDGMVAPSGKFGNFSEYFDCTKEPAIKLQKIVRDSEANYEAIGRPMLHGAGLDYETVRKALKNIVLDDAPTRIEDVEMFDDYAAQGIPDEYPELEARMMIPRKKRSATTRRGRRAASPVVEVAAPAQDLTRRARRPNIRNFDQ